MIENPGNIGDFIGGIGVVITLVYLASQIRQNTRSLRLSRIQQVMGTSVSVLNDAAHGPIPAISAKLESEQMISDDKYAQLVLYIYSMLTAHWQLIHQYKNGMIDQGIYDVYMVRMQMLLKTPVCRMVWRKCVNSSFPGDFLAVVEEQIAE